MKRIVFLMLVGFSLISITGCVTAKKVVRERVDQDISGNQGYVQGSGSASTGPRVTEREYIDIKIELPTWEELRTKPPKQKAQRERTADTDRTGNRGYITSGEGFEEELPPVYKEPEPGTSRRVPAHAYEYEEISVEETEAGRAVIEVDEEEIIIPSYQEYKVKKGDTLSHIAKNFYGKASRWTVIYEANSNKIKDPSRLKPGTVLIIPDLNEVESKYAK